MARNRKIFFVPVTDQPEMKKVNKRIKRQQPDKIRKGKKKPKREIKVPGKKKR